MQNVGRRSTAAMTTKMHNVVLGHLGMGTLLFALACGGGSGDNTYGAGDPNSTGTGTGNTGTGNLGLTGSGTSGGPTGGGTTVPGGVAGQTIDPNSACVSDAREGEQV